MNYTLLILFGIFISGIKCGYYFVTAPNIIRFEHDETVVVSVFGLQNAAVKVWLQHGVKRISEKNVVVANEKTPQYTTVRVTANDLFNTVVEDKPRTIYIFAEWNRQTQSREVILSYKTGYLIVQMNKPIYTPFQKVNIRTLALDESLRKVNGWQVVMDIVDPSNRTVGRKTTATSASGFFEHIFRLPPYAEFGIWTARAFYKGQLETEASTFFEVREYVIPTYGVEIDVDVPCILQDTDRVHVTVRAKYVYGKPVVGDARLTLKLKYNIGNSEYILDINKQSLEINDNNEGSLTKFNIDVADILNSPLLKNKDFPDGRRLQVVATVFESATGKEEATSHEGIVFATERFIFKFTKSKLNFRPGWEYFFKVETLYANGQPAAGVDIEVKMYKNGVFDQSKTTTTDKNGQTVSTCYTSRDTNVIDFTVTTSDKRQISEKFRVEAHMGRNQIQVNLDITNDNTMMDMQAYTNIRGSEYTGMIFMVVTRGKIVYTKFKEATNRASEQIMKDLQELVSPDARLIVFYVDKDSNELVADSVKFEVEKKCRGKELNLASDKDEAKPGSSVKLTITGSPNMWVGLNVMDKALLFLNNKNVLKKNKMLEALQSHDLGCGVGGGKNSADVFKKSGLTVLTNAQVDVNDLVRNTYDCEKKRRKRESEHCYNGTNMICYKQGAHLADELIYNTGSTKDMKTCVNCSTKARELTREKRSENTHIKKRSLYDESNYKADMGRLAETGVKSYVRTDFRESWLFEVVELDKNGQAIRFLYFPDSVTEWTIQGIGITTDKGICIAEDIDIKAFRQMFIHLDLPYAAVRLEHLDVKATIFNHGHSFDGDKLVNIYLEGVEHLCYNSVQGKPSPKVRIELPPNSAKTVSFPMIPLRKGNFQVKVTAIAVNTGYSEVDVIEKPLYVVNEGVEEKIEINVCLDPLKMKDDCRNGDRVIIDVNHGGERVYKIDLTLPKDSIPQTGSAAAYMQSNIMTDVVNTIIEGVESLFRLPVGMGEDTMIRLAPTVFAMSYLKQTKQVTKDIAEKGNQWIRNGIDREVSHYRHPDGSYSALKHKASSTWLTAFVAKVFCEANKTVDDAIDERDIKVTIDWLIDNVKNDGSFVDNMPVIHREMIGQMNERRPSLTAFVLISLKECAIMSDGVKGTIAKARMFLENLPEAAFRNNPYLLAISTYALALVDSTHKYRFKNLLHQIQKMDGNHLYWGNPGSKPASAHSVETTAYALLAMIEFNDFKISAFIVRWLTSQRDASGSFRSTQETVVGLQALTKYSQTTHCAEVDLKVTMLADDWIGEHFSITNENRVVQKIVRKLPVEHRDNVLTVTVKGTGSGIMTIDLRYNRPFNCPFLISDVEVEEIDDTSIDINLAKERKCDVCGRCEINLEIPDIFDFGMFDATVGANPKQASTTRMSNKTKTCIRFSVSSLNEKLHGMFIVNFGLETGVKVVPSDLDKLIQENQNIARYEMHTSGHKFYLNEVTSQETNFIFRLKDEFDGDKNARQPSSIKVYDQYNPAWQCTKLYGTGLYRGPNVVFECDNERKQCQCLQNMCVKPVENEIRMMVMRRARPELLLYRYTCNAEKANYAVRVEIESLDYNIETNQKTARAIVLKSLNKGIEKLRKDDQMIFFWNMNCEKPNLEERRRYIIIGRDGNKFKIDDREEYRYPLMGSALVLTDYNRRENPILSTVLKRYQRFIETRGCQH